MDRILDIEETNVGVHTLLVTSDGQIVLQQRDVNPNIINSGKVAMFGGTIKKNDDLLAGLRRELMEELELDCDNFSVERLGTDLKTKEFDGVDYTIHVYIIRDVDLKSLHLHEGAGFVVGKPKEIIKNTLLTRITKLALQDLISQC